MMLASERKVANWPYGFIRICKRSINEEEKQRPPKDPNFTCVFFRLVILMHYSSCSKLSHFGRRNKKQMFSNLLRPLPCEPSPHARGRSSCSSLWKPPRGELFCPWNKRVGNRRPLRNPRMIRCANGHKKSCSIDNHCCSPKA